MTWALDMDGVIWRGQEPIAGSSEAVAHLLEANRRVVYVTNNSALRAQGYADKLKRCGISADAQDIIHGGHAVARLVEPSSNVLICAGDGVIEAVSGRGANVILPSEFEGYELPDVDSVIVGWRPDYDYRLMSLAVRAVLSGARLLAPSADPLYPSDDGVLIGGGSITAAISYATKTEAVFAGKPFEPMVDVVLERAGEVEVVVGDQPFTDGGLAQKLGAAFALVKTGVHQDGEVTDIPVATTAQDLASVVELRLRGSS